MKNLSTLFSLVSIGAFLLTIPSYAGYSCETSSTKFPDALNWNNVFFLMKDGNFASQAATQLKCTASFGGDTFLITKDALEKFKFGYWDEGQGDDSKDPFYLTMWAAKKSYHNYPTYKGESKGKTLNLKLGFNQPKTEQLTLKGFCDVGNERYIELELESEGIFGSTINGPVYCLNTPLLEYNKTTR